MSLSKSYIVKLSNAILRREIVLGAGESIVTENVLAILADFDERLSALENPPEKSNPVAAGGVQRDEAAIAATGYAQVVTPEILDAVQAPPQEAAPGTPEAAIYQTGIVEG